MCLVLDNDDSFEICLGSIQGCWIRVRGVIPDVSLVEKHVHVPLVSRKTAIIISASTTSDPESGHDLSYTIDLLDFSSFHRSLVETRKE